MSPNGAQAICRKMISFVAMTVFAMGVSRGGRTAARPNDASKNCRQRLHDAAPDWIE